MTNRNWNYKEMGFNSETEMKESIARVERRMKMGDVEIEIERRREAQSGIDGGGNINFTALNEGARLEELDRVVHNHILYDREQAEQQAKHEEMQSLMKASGEHTKVENETNAQREMQKAKEKAEAELQKEIYSKYGIKTDEQQAKDEALGNMLRSLKF